VRDLLRLAVVAAVVAAWVTVSPDAAGFDAKIIGRVVDGQSGAALAGAAVRLHKVGVLGAPDSGIRTNADGFFTFDRVPTGFYHVSASLDGYSEGLSGKTAQGDQPVTTEITDADAQKDVVVRMFRRATVSGRVTDSRGRPVADATVWSISRPWVGGRQRLRASQAGRTDARGEYRINIIAPGEYVFGVAPHPSPQLPTTMPIYYGNATRLSGARPLIVEMGAELAGIDFAFPEESYTSVDGQLAGVEIGQQFFRAQLVPMEVSGEPGLIPVGSSAVDFNGRFTFRGIREGEYQLTVLRLPGSRDSANDRPLLGFIRFVGGSLELIPPPNLEGPTWYSEQVLKVGREGAHDVKVNLTQGRPITGRVLFNSVAQQPQAGSVQKIVLRAQHERLWMGTPFQATVEADGTFRTVGLPPGPYALSIANVPSGWNLGGIHGPNGEDLTVRDVVVGASDVNGIMITFNDRETKLMGTVVDDAGNPAAGEVIVFPAEQRQWQDFSSAMYRFRRVATTDRGNYSTQAILPGAYFVVAVQQGSQIQFEPALLSKLAALATKVTLAVGEPMTMRLTAHQVR